MQSHPEHSKFAGMTVNERLAEAGLIAQWDDACRRSDRDEMIRVLLRVDLSEARAASCVDAVVAHPEIYLGHLRPTK
jgi:hypothetical protein